MFIFQVVQRQSLSHSLLLGYPAEAPAEERVFSMFSPRVFLMSMKSEVRGVNRSATSP